MALTATVFLKEAWRALPGAFGFGRAVTASYQNEQIAQ